MSPTLFTRFRLWLTCRQPAQKRRKRIFGPWLPCPGQHLSGSASVPRDDSRISACPLSPHAPQAELPARPSPCASEPRGCPEVQRLVSAPSMPGSPLPLTAHPPRGSGRVGRALGPLSIPALLFFHIFSPRKAGEGAAGLSRASAALQGRGKASPRFLKVLGSLSLRKLWGWSQRLTESERFGPGGTESSPRSTRLP